MLTETIGTADMLVDVLFYLHYVLWLIISLRVLARNDLSPPARMAWIVVLFVLPYLGVVVYWLFGEVHLGRGFKRRHNKITSKLRIHNSDVLTDNNETTLSHITPRYCPAVLFATAVTDFNMVRGNQVRLMEDAEETHQSMLADFASATYHIHVLYYIWLEDKTGTQTAQALIKAAQRGVRCRVMVDGLGSRRLVRSKLWQQMKQAGIEVSVARPIHNIFKVLLFSRIDLRNHRKITIIDGAIGYVGSQNCADPEFRIKPKYAPWVDIMLRVEGPVIAQNQMLFASDWLMENPDTPLEAFPYNLDALDALDAPPDAETLAQVFADGPTRSKEETPQFLNILIHQAQSSLTISTPYFVPDNTLLSTLCATAKRGVTVSLILPKKNDSIIVAATSHSHYLELLESGVRIYEYKRGLLHAKTLTVDGQISLIGSTNLDMRSFDLNYENNMLFYSKRLTHNIIERQHQYIEDSIRVSRQEVKRWSLYRRIWNNVVATMGPVL